MPRRIPRELRKEATGTLFGKRRKGGKSTSRPSVPITLSPMELFFPIPESLMNPPTKSKSKNSNKKHVSFETYVQIVEIPSHRSFTPEMKQDIWIGHDDEVDTLQRIHCMTGRLEVVAEETESEWVEVHSGAWTEESSSASEDDWFP